MHTYRRSVKFILCLPSEWCFPLKHWTQICPFETSVRPLLSPKCVLSVGFPHCAELAPTDLVLGFCPISSIGLQLHLRNKCRSHGHCANGVVLSAEAPRPWEKMSIRVFSSVQMFKPREISDSILCNATCVRAQVTMHDFVTSLVCEVGQQGVKIRGLRCTEAENRTRQRWTLRRARRSELHASTHTHRTGGVGMRSPTGSDVHK